MDTIVESGITYTKASVLAKQFRYTSDYIGQLCRAGKVDCRLVGRSWYVSESALLAHKDARYKEIRLDEKTSSIKVSGDTTEVQPRLSRVAAKQLQHKPLHFEGRLGSFVSKYFTDEDDLLPQPLRRIKPIVPVQIPIVLSEAVHVEVKNNEKSASLEFSQMPSVPLSGRLEVENIEYNTLDDSAEPVTVDDVLPPAKKVISKPKTIQESLVKPTLGTTSTPSHVTTHFEKVVFTPASVIKPAKVAAGRHTKLVIVSALVSSVSLALFFLIASQTMVVVRGTMVSQVEINPAALMIIWSQLSEQL